MSLPTPTFTTALHWGLGRALQQLAAYVTPEMREAVLDACLHCHSFDPQAEGEPTAYLLKAAALAGILPQLEPVLSEQIRQLDAEAFDHWDTVQRLQLLVGLAKQGNKQAAQTIREAYLRFSESTCELHELIAERFIALDGVSALETVLRDEAQAFAERGDSTGGIILWQSELQLGKAVARRTIKRLARQEPQVKAFVETLNVPRERIHRPKLPTTLAEIYEFLARTQPKRLLYGANYFRFVKMPKRDWLHLQSSLLHEPDASRRAFLVAAFRFQPTRWGIDPVLALLQDPNEHVVKAAARTLAAHHHPSVRTLALAFLQQPERAEQGIALLTRNAESGDAAVIQQVLSCQNDPDNLHKLLFDLPALVQLNPTPEFANLLAETYACQPCSHCRIKQVATLFKLSLLPDWLRQEALLDANQEVREAAEGIIIP